MDTISLAVEAKRTAVKFDLRNYIETNVVLNKSHGLHPVYEAIANSLDAIAELSSRIRGKIVVRIIRDMKEPVQMDMLGGKDEHPIIGFEIEDNGIGFTEKNYDSFCLGASSQKKTKGGKGLGRLTWLKVFDHAEIESVFKEDDKMHTRTFTFTAETVSGIKHNQIQSCTATRTSTIVRLNGKKSYFNLPKKTITIAKSIINHYIAQIIINDNLTITLSDPESDQGDIDLKEIIKSEYTALDKIDSFDDHDCKFLLRHLFVNNSTHKHQVIFCAKNQKVESHSIASYIPHLESTVNINGKECVYLGILTGKYFDDNVNTTRTALVMNDDNEDTLWPTDVCRKDLMKSVSNLILPHVQGPIEEVRTATRRKIDNVISTSAPEMRHVFERNLDVLNKLSPSSDEGDIYTCLAGARFKERQQYLEDIKTAISKTGSADHLERISKDHIEEFYKGAHQEATACLIQFVFHRKSVLDLLNLFLGNTLQGKKEKEKAIHNLIFPMKTTTDTIPLEATNLWVIDEALAFQGYLASDIPFSEHDALESESLNRSDVAAYHTPNPKFWESSFALSEQEINSSSITIIEFKQPHRDNYTRQDNPYEQVKKYILDIREGKQVDRFGRTFANPENIRFYVFIALDMTVKLANLLKTNYGFRESADGDGLFLTEPHLNWHIEVMSYQKMIHDANRRNLAYFKALKISSP
jgi:hypothetical protein